MGEHQEWSKFSNYEVATRVPMIFSTAPNKASSTSSDLMTLRAAESTKVTSEYFKQYIKSRKLTYDDGVKIQRKYDGVVELIDLFPTLVNLAGLPQLQTCPSESRNISTCAEGASLACIILSKASRSSLTKDKTSFCSRKHAVLSQYPRPTPFPSKNPDSDQPRLTETKIMGYSLRSNRFRYTSWIKFNHSSFKVDFDSVYAEELYDHMFDDGENDNILIQVREKANGFRNYLKMLLHM